MNSFILQSLRAYCDGNYDKWPELLPSIMMAYRMTPATQSTGYSPYYLMFGREMRMPVDAMLIPKDTMARDHKDHLNHVIKSLRIARQIATENIQRHQQKYKHQHDKKAAMPKFRILDKVLMFVPKVPVGVPPKLHSKWQGPFYILGEGPNHTYRLADCETDKPLKTLVNAARLKLYKDPRNRPQYEDSSDEDEDDTSSSSSSSSSSDSDSSQSDEEDEDQEHGTAAAKDADRPQKLEQPKPDKNIREILQAKKQGSKTWYKVSYHNQRGTQWRLSSYVDADLRNRYHAERTMAGKKKKPKEGLKYFKADEQLTQKNLTPTNPSKQTSQNDETRVQVITGCQSHIPSTCSNATQTEISALSSSLISERHEGSSRCRVCNPHAKNNRL